MANEDRLREYLEQVTVKLNQTRRCLRGGQDRPRKPLALDRASPVVSQSDVSAGTYGRHYAWLLASAEPRLPTSDVFAEFSQRPGRGFAGLGFDSLTSLEIRHRLTVLTGPRLPARRQRRCSSSSSRADRRRT